MSGHSKWSTIKHGKAATDARRGKLFTKLTREIITAARQSGGNPDMNIRLRMAIQRARENNMPTDNVDRAIKRGTGEGSGQDQMTETTYEGYGPGGTAILLQTLTDNPRRTVSEIRSTLTKAGGNLGDAGSVAWQFEQKGVVIVEVDPERAEELALAAIDAGADEFDTYESTLQVESAPELMEEVRKTLAALDVSIESSEFAMVPKNTVALEKPAALRTLRLLDQLEELDDVQKVFSNADFPNEALEQYKGEA